MSTQRRYSWPNRILLLSKPTYAPGNYSRGGIRRVRNGALRFAFETTLGGTTITRELLEAAADGVDLYVWYAGLASPDLHIERVAQRVRNGGHDIDPERIQKRYDASPKNLCRLLPYAKELYLYDNSTTVDVDGGQRPQPLKVLEMREHLITSIVRPTPKWAEHVVDFANKAAWPEP